MGPQKAARRNEWHCRIKELITMQGEGERDGDGVVDGLVLPSTLRVREAMNKFVANSDEFCGLQAQNLPGSFSSFPQTSAMTFVNEVHGADRFMEGIPLPNAPICMNQENIRYDGIGSSLETMLLHGYGGLLPSELLGKVVGKTRIPPPPPVGRGFHSREWMSSNSQGSSQFSNELSLSLVPTRRPVLYESSQCSEQLSSCSEHASCSSKRDLSWSRFEAQKPLQLPTLQSGSRFLQAMQEILAGIACYALVNFEDGVNFSAIGSSNRPGSNPDPAFVFQKQERSVEAKKKHLLTLLQMVDEQYSQCLDEIHTVTSAFHAVTELDPNLHARFALPTISLMYKNLRERISTHILAAGAHHVKEGQQQTQENKSFEACFIQKQWALQQLSKRDHQLWRPQRGLPETSVSVLRTWMFQNFLHPYPKDSEKHLLALKSGLTRNQVSNWFINARVRLWKPMIEEMCAEMNRRKARREDEEIEGNHRNHMQLETRRRLTRD